MLDKPVSVALVGDYNKAVIAHEAIPSALKLAAKALNIQVDFSWIPTPALLSTVSILSEYDAVWCTPGSPYLSMEGALHAITFAREGLIPFLGTCGGFQHTLIEYARKVLLLEESDHLESNPDTTLPLISPLTCSLSGSTGTIFLKEGSQARRIYGREQIIEPFNCNFGVNPEYRHLFEESSRLHVTGVDALGSIRVIELDKHPFFMATLYQPERSALASKSHPLIEAFLRASIIQSQN